MASSSIVSLRDLGRFCCLRMEEGQAAAEAARQPMHERVDLEATEVVQRLLAAGDYTGILKALSRGLPPGRRMTFLTEHAGLHGPLLFEQAAALTADAVRNRAPSDEDTFQRLRQSMPILAKARCATLVFELFRLNLTAAECVSRLEDSAKEGRRLRQDLLPGMLSAILENPIRGSCAILTETAQHEALLLADRLDAVYSQVIDNLRLKHAADIFHPDRGSGLPNDGTACLDFMCAVADFRSQIQRGEPLHGPGEWNDPETKDRLLACLDAVQLQAKCEVLSRMRWSRGSNSCYEEERNVLRDLLEQFERGDLPKEDLIEGARCYLGGSFDKAHESDLMAEMDRELRRPDAEMGPMIMRQCEASQRREAWEKGYQRAHTRPGEDCCIM